MDTVVVIMQKDRKTGMFEKELQTLNIINNEEFILNMYAIKDDENNIYIHLKLTTDRDVLNWEYNAIYDYYDLDIFKDDNLVISECDNEYNPTWEIILPYVESSQELSNKIDKVLRKHKDELTDVFSTIIDKEGEYLNEE